MQRVIGRDEWMLLAEASKSNSLEVVEDNAIIIGKIAGGELSSLDSTPSSSVREWEGLWRGLRTTAHISDAMA